MPLKIAATASNMFSLTFTFSSLQDTSVSRIHFLLCTCFCLCLKYLFFLLKPFYWGMIDIEKLYIFNVNYLMSLEVSIALGNHHINVCVRSVVQSCLTLCDPMDCSPPGFSVHGDSPGNRTGVDCHAFLQRIFQTQGSNPHLLSLLHCQVGSSPLCHLGISPQSMLSTYISFPNISSCILYYYCTP